MTFSSVEQQRLDEISWAGFFCGKFSGLQKTHPDYIEAVSEAGPAQILVRLSIKCVRCLPLSTYNKPKMATVACSVIQLHIFLLPIPPIRPFYHFALPYIHSLLAYNLPSFFSSSLLFIPSLLMDRRPMLSHGKMSLLALRGHRRRERNFSSCPFFFISCFFYALPHRAFKSPMTRK